MKTPLPFDSQFEEMLNQTIKSYKDDCAYYEVDEDNFEHFRRYMFVMITGLGQMILNKKKDVSGEEAK